MYVVALSCICHLYHCKLHAAWQRIKVLDGAPMDLLVYASLCIAVLQCNNRLCCLCGHAMFLQQHVACSGLM